MVDLFGFERFIEKRGSIKKFGKPSDEVVEKYKNNIPEYIIEVWKTFGFGSYAEGMFFISNPNPFESITEIYFGKKSTHTVIGRSSFGDLIIWDAEDSSIISLNASSGKGVRMADDGDIDGFFAFTMNNDKFYDAHNYQMHLKAVEKFGQLEEDQVFGFFPALSMGGKEKLENIKVVQIREYLAMLAEIAVEQNREIAARDA
jgi:hypothetical protein